MHGPFRDTIEDLKHKLECETEQADAYKRRLLAVKEEMDSYKQRAEAFIASLTEERDKLKSNLHNAKRCWEETGLFLEPTDSIVQSLPVE
jgi:uncharacterized coiled-coil DUF342 family protein